MCCTEYIQSFRGKLRYMIDQKQYFHNQVEVEYKISSLQPMKLINVKDLQKLIK